MRLTRSVTSPSHWHGPVSQPDMSAVFDDVVQCTDVLLVLIAPMAPLHRQSSCSVHCTAALPVLGGLADIERTQHTHSENSPTRELPTADCCKTGIFDNKYSEESFIFIWLSKKGLASMTKSVMIMQGTEKV